MKSKSLPSIFGFALLIALGSSALRAADATERAIFDGKSLDNWEGNTNYWKIEDGAITGEIPEGKSLGNNEFLYWKGEISDFSLNVEFRISGGPSANSGIQIRSRKNPDGHAAGLQCDLDAGAAWLGRIYDEHGRALLVERGARVSIAPDGRKWTDTFAPADSFKTLLKPNGEWNTYSIIAWASHLEVRVNGMLVSVLDDHQTGKAQWSGRLAFQLHSGPGPAKIQFRSVRLAELGKTEFPKRDTKAAAVETPTANADSTAIKATGPDGKPLNLDFETGTLQDWTAEGAAFNGQPIKGDTVKPRKAGEQSAHAGEFWIGGYEKSGDNEIGTLTSAPFEVKHPWASFLVGGGSEKHTRIELVDAASNKVFAQYQGTNVETMRRESVDLTAMQGKRIFIRIVDEYRSGWGHINFDDFVFHAKAPPKDAAKPRATTSAGRQNESAVLWHLGANTAKPSAVGNDAGRKLINGMLLQDGFQAEMLATEPDIVQPIAFAIDERGRMWIAEALSYPNRRPEGKGQDRIVILADEDGDGSFETRKVFFEGLNLVSGLEVGFGGVWVGAAPYLMFIADRDGDDKADGKPEILLDGWGYQDTHETLNSFTWGPDGWLYGNQGVFTRSLVGAPGTPDAQRLEIRAGVWRYHPTQKRFEIFASGGSNQWGIDFNDRGHLFMTHCRSFWGGGGTTYVIRNGQYWNQANSNYAPYIASKQPAGVPELKNYLPSSAKYDSGEGGAGKPGTTAVYGGHSHVGTMIYLGDNWPAIYRNHLFTHNLHGHQLNHQHNIRSGAGYETLHAGYDMLYVPDSTYVAVDLQTGPDGTVYAIDWSDRQHCHTPQDEKWDRSNGRLYRLAWAATYKPVKTNLNALSDAELFTLLSHRNEWHVRTAQRILQSRAADGKLDAAITAQLRQMFADAKDEPRALRALWAMHVTGTLDEATLKSATAHAMEDVRAWAVQLSTEKTPIAAAQVETLARLAKEDPSSQVRLAVASALPLVPPELRWNIGESLAAHAEDADDRWMPKMIWAALAPQSQDDPKRTLALAATTKMRTLTASIQWYLARFPAGREELVARVAADDNDDAALAALRLLSAGLADSGAKATIPAAWLKIEERFAASANSALRGVFEQLSIAFGDKKSYQKMLAVLAADATPLPERKRAFDLVRKSHDASAIPTFVKLLELPEFRSDVIPLLARSDAPEVSTALLSQFSKFNPADRSAALLTLTSRPKLSIALLTELKEKRFDRKDLNSLHIRQMKNLRDDAVSKLLDEAWGAVAETSGNAREAIEKLNKKFSDAPLWAFSAEAGQKIFQRSCVACHAVGGVGGKIGPDLAGSWRNGVGYFIENIVDPNAVVGEDFQMHVIARNDGSVVSGLLESESDAAVTVRTATETVVIRKDEIKKRRKTPQSLMPEGLLDTLSEREVIELLKYLTTKN